MNEVKTMVELKKEAVKDVTSLTKAAPVALAKTKEVLNQAVADLYVAHVALHQVHWYMRGRGFLVWHPKMDEYMDALDGQLDEISERLITLGGSPFSTLTEFLQNSEIEEEAGEYRNVEESLERVLAIYRYLSELFQKGLDVTDEEGDDVTNGIFSDAKTETDKINTYVLTRMPIAYSNLKFSTSLTIMNIILGKLKYLTRYYLFPVKKLIRVIYHLQIKKI